MFKVKDNVTLPPVDKQAGVDHKYPFNTMQLGEIFFVPGMTTDRFTTYASARGRRLGKRFSTQTAVMRQDLQTDEWEPCRATAPGAKVGVAVTRTA